MTSIQQKRYEGFLNTPFLWQNDIVFGLKQFDSASVISKINSTNNEDLRLGKYVERLVFFELAQQQNITVLAENIQIQQNKTTLGELDCLLLKDEQPIHLEIIYKFYVFDTSVGNSEIEHCIGPNRKDTLIEKLTKLKDKQLPLLYGNACKPYLDKLNLKIETIIQHVYFKAQLFLPFAHQNIQLKTLNNNCIVGFYIKQDELANFKNCKFYIPKKKDWLITPHTHVEWLNYNQITHVAHSYFKQKYAALLWIKLKSGVLKKVFLLWW